MIHIAVVEDDRKDREQIVGYINQFSSASGESIKTSQFEKRGDFSVQLLSDI